MWCMCGDYIVSFDCVVSDEIIPNFFFPTFQFIFVIDFLIKDEMCVCFFPLYSRFDRSMLVYKFAIDVCLLKRNNTVNIHSKVKVLNFVTVKSEQ